jgi:hypothetical protein
VHIESVVQDITFIAMQGLSSRPQHSVAGLGLQTLPQQTQLLHARCNSSSGCRLLRCSLLALLQPSWFKEWINIYVSAIVLPVSHRVLRSNFACMPPDGSSLTLCTSSEELVLS